MDVPWKDDIRIIIANNDFYIKLMTATEHLQGVVDWSGQVREEIPWHMASQLVIKMTIKNHLS